MRGEEKRLEHNLRTPRSEDGSVPWVLVLLDFLLSPRYYQTLAIAMLLQ